jgi:CheY-like chemotaxis protein
MNQTKNHSILVVDDYEDISYMVKTLLQKYGLTFMSSMTRYWH